MEYKVWEVSEHTTKNIFCIRKPGRPKIINIAIIIIILIIIAIIIIIYIIILIG